MLHEFRVENRTSVPGTFFFVFFSFFRFKTLRWDRPFRVYHQVCTRYVPVVSTTCCCTRSREVQVPQAPGTTAPVRVSHLRTPSEYVPWLPSSIKLGGPRRTKVPRGGTTYDTFGTPSGHVLLYCSALCFVAGFVRYRLRIVLRLGGSTAVVRGLPKPLLAFARTSTAVARIAAQASSAKRMAS